MDERDWLACADPRAMLRALQAGVRVSDRKARLCAVAWARCFHRHAGGLPQSAPLLSWLAGPQWLPQLEAAEAYADGRLGREGLRAARQQTGGPYNLYRVAAGLSRFSLGGALDILDSLRAEFGVPPAEELCDVLRCVFGHPPFHPPPLAPSALAWNEGTIARLARAAHEERPPSTGRLDPARLAVLADALEEAGCTDADLTGHLRGPGPHVRGCHAVDLLLGRT